MTPTWYPSSTFPINSLKKSSLTLRVVKERKKTNKFKQGFQFYIPKGVSIDDAGSNYVILESNETYSTYYIYIVRETDSIETILQKYNVSKEDIEMYNDIKELKVGDKIIIPSMNA